MKETHEYYMLKKQIQECNDLLNEVLSQFNKLKYSGEIEFGDPYNVGRSKKQISVSLRKDDEQDI